MLHKFTFISTTTNIKYELANNKKCFLMLLDENNTAKPDSICRGKTFYR